jgi:hypothetical protein
MCVFALGAPEARPEAERWLAVNVADTAAAFPAVIVAGRPATIVGSVDLDYSSVDCGREVFSTGAVVKEELTLPSAVTLRDAGGSVRQATLARGGRSLQIKGPVAAAVPGVFTASLHATAIMRKGRTCSGEQTFTLLAVAGDPILRVSGGYLDRHGLTVALSAALPPLPGGQVLPDGAIQGATDEVHFRDLEDTGEDGRDVSDVLSVFLGKRRLDWRSGGSHTGGALTCLNYPRPAHFRGGLLRYRLKFDWNTEMGFHKVVGAGRVRIHGHPFSKLDRGCQAVNRS